jgi:hypothetical protein
MEYRAQQGLHDAASSFAIATWLDALDTDAGPHSCRVYWGSHGCDRTRAHHGPHLCSCGHDGYWYDGRPQTRYYGEDVELAAVIALVDALGEVE